MEFSGRLSAFPPADILQWVHNDRRTGALVVRRSGRTKRIYFSRGDIVACFSDDPSEYYGQLLLLKGYLEQDGLIRALNECQQRGVRLGAALNQLGLLPPDVIQRTLREQIEDSVCDIFLWDSGVFYFEEDAPPDEEILPEPIQSMRLAMEGARWRDEYHRIRRLFIHDNIVLCGGARWPGQGLSRLEEQITTSVDGQSSLEEMYRRISGSQFRFLQAAYRLALTEVVDILEVGEDTGGRTHESGVHHLLFQQAANEAVHAAQRQRSVPLELLERLYPLWVARVPAPTGDSSSDILLDLYRRCDGSMILKQVFSTNPERMEKELDLLLLEIRQGRIALLPAPPGEIQQALVGRGDTQSRRWWRNALAPEDQ